MFENFTTRVTTVTKYTAIPTSSYFSSCLLRLEPAEASPSSVLESNSQQRNSTSSHAKLYAYTVIKLSKMLLYRHHEALRERLLLRTFDRHKRIGNPTAIALTIARPAMQYPTCCSTLLPTPNSETMTINATTDGIRARSCR